jgi:hypothetical protein
VEEQGDDGVAAPVESDKKKVKKAPSKKKKNKSKKKDGEDDDDDSDNGIGSIDEAKEAKGATRKTKKAPDHQRITETDSLPKLWDEERARKNGSCSESSVFGRTQSYDAIVP